MEDIANLLWELSLVNFKSLDTGQELVGSVVGISSKLGRPPLLLPYRKKKMICKTLSKKILLLCLRFRSLSV